MKIYELNQEIENLLENYYNCFDENGEQIKTDEEIQAIQKQLEEHQNRKNELKEWVLNKRQNDLIYINGLELEIKRLTEMKERKQKMVNNRENFIKYLFGYLEKPIYFGNFQLGYRKSKSVELSEDFNVKEYMREKISYFPDKIAIKKDLEAGKEIKGAYIKENLNFYIK